MEPVVKDTSLLTLTSAWLACLFCGQRAYRVYGYRPQEGYDPNLRRFLCKNGHNIYKVLTDEQIGMLTIK